MAKLTQKALMPNDTALGDLVHLVDVSDTSQSPQGSSYKYPMSQLVDFLKKAGIGNWQLAAPTVNDDVTQGYINGAFWFDEDAQRFYILNDNSVGAADWVAFGLQFVYGGGRVVNGNRFTLTSSNVVAIGNESVDGNTGSFVIALGRDTAKNNTGSQVIAIGWQSLQSNSGNFVYGFGDYSAQNNIGANVVAIGQSAAVNNQGANVVAIGQQSGAQNEGANVIAIGLESGVNNEADDSNFFGRLAGKNNTTSHGVTVFSPESVPSYADHTAALAALTVANGCVASQVYIYRNVATNAIGFVLPV